MESPMDFCSFPLEPARLLNPFLAEQKSVSQRSGRGHELGTKRSRAGGNGLATPASGPRGPSSALTFILQACSNTVDFAWLIDFSIQTDLPSTQRCSIPSLGNPQL